MKNSINAKRIAFLTRDIKIFDTSHLRHINRIIASRNNHANDYRAFALKTKISDDFRATNASN